MINAELRCSNYMQGRAVELCLICAVVFDRACFGDWRVQDFFGQELPAVPGTTRPRPWPLCGLMRTILAVP